ncbi:mitochondrial import inner membrane translocase subunit TIM50 [Plectropomus leopardus]|uniref:mitochondrial import inner membrane translocase subunit TIM50 n=1 Tax=Plectropomus leopardus TaxID=160734 RepID=UPI001C4D8E30|nr:mitochondrial import inner membrane translocase subunit TIM50 [Plectropomus leopardus]
MAVFCRNRRSDSFLLLIGPDAFEPALLPLHVAYRCSERSSRLPLNPASANQVLLSFSHTLAGQLALLSNMSATPVFPMCVRASRALLRLRSGAVGASSPAAVDMIRTLSTDKPPAGAGGATGGLAQAILQERLQQQQQSQGQPPPEGGEGEKEGGQEDKKQKENTAYAKKMVLRLAGLMGLGGAVGMVYVFGTNSVDEQGNVVGDPLPVVQDALKDTLHRRPWRVSAV